MLPASARALLTGLVDYAGLFPPAHESMAEAVRAYAAHRSGRMAWMLGRFVCPSARLDEFAQCVDAHLPSPEGAWTVSALVGPEAERELSTIAALNAAHRGVVIDAIETRATSTDDVVRLGRLLRAYPIVAYVEIPVTEDPAPLLDAIAAAGLRAKIRTGGITADAFPTAAQVARFLGGCVRRDLPFKATAGLHHPLRGEYRLTYEPASAAGTMFGFLNVLLAAAWLRDGATDADAIALLETRDHQALTFTDAGVRWRDVLLLSARLDRARDRAVVAVGSCSFTEPVRELSFVPGWEH